MSISRGQPQTQLQSSDEKKAALTSLLAEYRDLFAWSLMLPVPITPWWSSTAWLYGPMPSRLSRNRGKCILKC